ncbi:MAG: cytochrome oxidase putative small subunit CydP [Methylophilaceae bacterium]
MLFNRLNHHFNTRIQTGKTGRLALEISLALAIKLLLLWLLWMLFFSHPIAKNDRQQAVTRIILN